MKRFQIKKFKLVHRNSMIRGNAIDKSFPAWGIVDTKWQTSRHRGCYFGGYEKSCYGNYVTHDQQLRTVFRNEALGKSVCAKMNELDAAIGNPSDIGFKMVDGRFDPPISSADEIEVTSFD